MILIVRTKSELKSEQLCRSLSLNGKNFLRMTIVSKLLFLDKMFLWDITLFDVQQQQ